RGAAAGLDRGRQGRRALLRARDRAARREQRGWHDRRLDAAARVPAGQGREPHRQRGARGEPGRVRRHVETAGHHRVGVTLRPPHPADDPLAPLRTRSWLTEAQRKAIHIGSLILPLGILFEWLPWPRGRSQWRWFLIACTLVAIGIDLLRIHEDRVRRFFRDFFGQMIREHERFSLSGSTYLLIAALLAIEIFPRPIAAAALGFTVLGDSFAALVGKAWGRHRFFGKTFEGAAGGLVACLAWSAFL